MSQIVRQGLVTLLSSSDVAEINFSVRSFRVDQQLYIDVLHRLTVFDINHRRGGITVVTPRHPLRIRIRRMRSAGEYNSDANAIILPDENVLATDQGRKTAVHECTHAGFDIHRIRGIGMHDEMAATIAGCWYLINRQADLPVPQPVIEATQRLRARPGSALTEDEIQSLYPAMLELGYTWGGTRYPPYNGIRI